MNWSYGITTVPERVNTLLPETIGSLASSGFLNPLVFIDGAADIGELTGHGGLTIQFPNRGHLRNWLTALVGIFTANPTADRYAVFEDDFVCCNNLREYLEKMEWPENGYLNLLTHDENLLKVDGKRGWHLSNQLGRGAVALVFTQKAVLDLLRSPELFERTQETRRQCADGLVIDTLKPLGYREYIHYPSLVQHVGLVSSMGHDYGKVLGYIENYNPMELIEPLETKMDEATCLSRMVAPGQPRPGIWRGGIIQVHVTRACDLACFGCTQGSNLRGKPVMISPEDFEKAMQSLEGYWGVIGIFGGNPAIHPQFEELCRIASLYFPKTQLGIWCNNPLGKGAIMRQTFNPAVSNLNVHGIEAAYDEFKRDWPESRPFGQNGDSRHSPPFVAMKDVIPDEAKRWELISSCDINQRWSAMLCSIPGKGLRAFFCELAGAQAMLHANDPTWPDTGLEATAGWWQRPMTDFAEQVRVHCHSCGIPLRRFGQLSQAGEFEEVSETHADIYLTKEREREVKLVQIDDGLHLERVTDYVPNGKLQGI